MHVAAMDQPFPPEVRDEQYYSYENTFLTWNLPKVRMILKDVIPVEASFKNHSYFEWHYANGQMALALLNLGDVTSNRHYTDWVKRYCSTTLSTLDYFKFQFETLQEKRGFNYRIFRKKR